MGFYILTARKIYTKRDALRDTDNVFDKAFSEGYRLTGLEDYLEMSIRPYTLLNMI